MRWLVGIVIIVGLVWFGYRQTLGEPNHVERYMVSVDDRYLLLARECGWADLDVTETADQVRVRANNGPGCDDDSGVALGDRDVVEVGTAGLSWSRHIERDQRPLQDPTRFC